MSHRIEDILLMLLLKMDSVKPLNGSCHVPPALISATERDLLNLGGYSAGKPPDYPRGVGETLGFRSIAKATNAVYQNMSLRLGTTKLHICSTGKNIYSCAMIYLGDAETEQVGGTPARIHSALNTGIVLLLENGVVSGSYMTPVAGFTLSWHPQDLLCPGACPYPGTKQDAESLFDRIIPPLIPKGTKSLRALPDLVMLAVAAYGQYNRRA